MNSNLTKALEFIFNGRNYGVSLNMIMLEINKSKATIKRYIFLLKEINLVEFKGASKNGKYFITDTALHKIQEKIRLSQNKLK